MGLWTAQMFLMFTLNRPDVFPATDLALQKGFKFYFGLGQLPKVNEMIEMSQKWRPHRTTVSLFFWRPIWLCIFLSATHYFSKMTKKFFKIV